MFGMAARLRSGLNWHTEISRIGSICKTLRTGWQHRTCLTDSSHVSISTACTCSENWVCSRRQDIGLSEFFRNSSLVEQTQSQVKCVTAERGSSSLKNENQSTNLIRFLKDSHGICQLCFVPDRIASTKCGQRLPNTKGKFNMESNRQSKNSAATFSLRCRGFARPSCSRRCR